jgi:hypothetical protein
MPHLQQVGGVTDGVGAITRAHEMFSGGSGGGGAVKTSAAVVSGSENSDHGVRPAAALY